MSRLAPSALPASTAAAGCVLRLTRAGGGELDAAGKAELLGKLHSGARIPALTFDAVTYLQPVEGHNKNYVRFSARALQRMTSSFAGRPFLRDHAQDELAARGGTITGAELVDDGDNGGKSIRMNVEAVKPWAQEGLLDGTISMFSIGWSRNVASEPLCTVCDGPMFSYECSHFPGDVVELKSGRKVVCEMLYTDVDGVEVSAVNNPAVLGTGVEGIRAALSAHRASAPIERKPAMLTSLSKILGCAEDDATALDAVRALKAKHDGLASAHAETAAALNEANGKLAAAEAARAVAEKASQAAELEAVIEGAKHDGRLMPKIGPNKERLESDLEKAVRELAKISLAGAKAFVAQLPRVGPQAIQLRSQETPPADPKDNLGALTPAEKKVARDMGVSEEQYLKSKAERYAAAKEKE